MYFLNKLKIQKLDRMISEKIRVVVNAEKSKRRTTSKGLSFSRVRLEDITRGVAGFAEEDILKSCNKYFSLLDNLARDCIKTFQKFLDKETIKL